MIWFDEHRQEHGHTVKSVLELIGYSKQGLAKHKKLAAERAKHEVKVINEATILRRRHRKMSCRKLFDVIAPESMGRDRCEALLLSAGFRVKRTQPFIKTTESQSHLVFPNLIEGLELDHINQVWQSDMTYFWNGKGFFYFVFVTDVYSRRIIGHSAWPTRHAQAFIHALRMALRLRNIARYGETLIHHSDRGGQYVSAGYLSLQDKYEIRTSMCKYSWENPYVERINGTIKGEYLFEPIAELKRVRRELNATVRLYNEERPHLSLPQRMSPNHFEHALTTMLPKERPKFKIYKEQEKTSTKS